MKQLFTTLTFLISCTLMAQYTSPDTELTFDFDYLVTNSDGAVVMDGSDYLITENITIAASDTLREMNSISVKVAQGVEVTAQGGFFLSNTDGISFTWAEEGIHYEGFRFEGGSVVDLEFVTFEYGGGLRVLTENFHMESCIVSYQETLSSTGGAVGLSSGKPEIINCHFLSNVSAAINSGANIAVAPVIENCTFQFNGTSVVNKPQINLGPSGVDTTIIRNNIVEGHPDNTLSGGIGFSLLFGGEGHVVIEGNEVFNNRYGVAVIGNNVTSLIAGNTIYDNDIQGIPLEGGSGINLFASASNHAVITENEITGNLWGITLQGTATANLGDTTETNFNIGLNVFDDNGNGGEIYALFNNTPNDIMAMNNCWDGLNNTLTESEAEALISHEVDDSSLGLVTFTPLGFCGTVNLEESQKLTISVYPNPAREVLTLESNELIVSIIIHDLTGKVVVEEQLAQPDFVFRAYMALLQKGIYLVRIVTAKGEHSVRVMKE